MEIGRYVPMCILRSFVYDVGYNRCCEILAILCFREEVIVPLWSRTVVSRAFGIDAGSDYVYRVNRVLFRSSAITVHDVEKIVAPEAAVFVIFTKTLLHHSWFRAGPPRKEQIEAEQFVISLDDP